MAGGAEEELLVDFGDEGQVAEDGAASSFNTNASAQFPAAQPPAAASAADTSPSRGRDTERLPAGAVLQWASKLGRRATRLGEKAREALVEEARHLAEDARELGDGIREGARLTAQDTRAIGERFAREAKTQGLPGILSVKARVSQQPNAAFEAIAAEDATPEGVTTSSSSSGRCAAADGMASTGRAARSTAPDAGGPAALRNIRQSLAATAEVSSQMLRDLRDVNNEVTRDLRNSVRHAWRNASGVTTGGGSQDSCGNASDDVGGSGAGAHGSADETAECGGDLSNADATASAGMPVDPLRGNDVQRPAAVAEEPLAAANVDSPADKATRRPGVELQDEPTADPKRAAVVADAVRREQVSAEDIAAVFSAQRQSLRSIPAANAARVGQQYALDAVPMATSHLGPPDGVSLDLGPPVEVPGGTAGITTAPGVSDASFDDMWNDILGDDKAS